MLWWRSTRPLRPTLKSRGYTWTVLENRDHATKKNVDWSGKSTHLWGRVGCQLFVTLKVTRASSESLVLIWAPNFRLNNLREPSWISLFRKKRSPVYMAALHTRGKLSHYVKDFYLVLHSIYYYESKVTRLMVLVIACLWPRKPMQIQRDPIKDW